ncbi:MAG: GH3 auxin-responsive promoter family protein [Oscillospiraceae bacterium]|nr:GH3 auxin-responsive promoter family protein [Oscillospiraceae bacterium]
MMSFLLNRICRQMYRGSYHRFLAPCNVRDVQLRYLHGLLMRNADTVYGRRFRFGSIRRFREFRENVPLTAYADYAPLIDRIANGESRVLTAEPVMLLEPTSGSSGGRKLIPYTKTLQNEFRQGIRPWLCDLYTKVPRLCNGKSYWSITPVTAGKEYTASGIPIGFEEDSAYFGAAEQLLMRRLFAVDGSVKFAGSTEQFYHDTTVQLLQCSCLSMISVWNPTFLTLLCGYIREHAAQLAKELPQCSSQLHAAEENRFDRVFRGLRLISCWADGSAAEEIPAVREMFPNVLIQPKGLLATECFTSLPLIGEQGARLSIYSHFFEFRSLRDGRIYTADCLSCGEYELIVTTGGGFYRYQTGDIVEVLGVYPDRPPRLRFLRRSGIACDLCGEKLTDDFVRNVCRKLGIAQHFCLLTPEGHGYDLYTSAENLSAEQLDRALCESYHYRYCRQLGQLRAVRVIHVSADPARVYLERMTAEGMRMGDIKPAFLSRLSGWQKYFETGGVST